MLRNSFDLRHQVLGIFFIVIVLKAKSLQLRQGMRAR